MRAERVGNPSLLLTDKEDITVPVFISCNDVPADSPSWQSMLTASLIPALYAKENNIFWTLDVIIFYEFVWLDRNYTVLLTL